MSLSLIVKKMVATIFIDEQRGVITGQVLEDTDGDGNGDQGITSVQVQLFDAQGNFIRSDFTDSDGNFRFNNLEAGNYQLSQINRPGFDDVSDSDGGDPNLIDVTVVNRQENDGNNFIDEQRGFITGQVLEDTDGDGSGDQGIVSAQVQLFDAQGNFIRSDFTDADGNYRFNNLEAGDYQLSQINRTGFDDVSDSDGGDPNLIDVTVVNRQENGGNNFIDEQRGFITGQVLEDTDGDGSGDQGIVSAQVQLFDAQGNFIRSDFTDADGNFRFNNLEAGDYQLSQINRPGFDDVSDSDGGDPNLIDVTVVNRQENDGNNFIDEQRGFITGQVLEDIDGDGSGDQGITSVQVQLFDAQGNFIRSDFTDADGNFRFNNLEAGNYQLSQINRPGFDDVSDSDGGDPNLIDVTVVNRQENGGNNFIDEQRGVITGQVLEDIDGDGSGDQGITSVQVQLFDAQGNFIRSDFTDGDGNFRFNNLEAGDYQLSQINRPGFDDVSDSDGGDPNLIDVTVVNRQENDGNNFIDEQRGFITGQVLEDIDGDGTGDRGMVSVQVQLFDAQGNFIRSDFTDGEGNFRFNNLDAGDYQLSQINRTGFDDVSDSDGGDPNLIDVTVVNRQENDGNNFIDEQRGFITGQVLEDTDGDGSGDQGIVSAQVQLFDAQGNFIRSDFTDADGNFRFNNLEAGNYQLSQINRPGFDDVSDSDGGDPNLIDVTVVNRQESAGNIFIDERVDLNIVGTSGMDMLEGDANDNVITGLEGADFLTGGGGNDNFIYNTLEDVGDIITDFEIGNDKIVLSELANNLGIDFSSLGFLEMGTGTLLTIDPDGSGFMPANPYIFLQGVLASDLNNQNNFTI